MISSDITLLKDQIRAIFHKADTVAFSHNPWRAEYLKGLALGARELLSKGEEKAAAILIERSGKMAEKWYPDEPPRNPDNSDESPDRPASDIHKKIAEYLDTQGKLPPNFHNQTKNFAGMSDENIKNYDPSADIEGRIWDAYRACSILEAGKWDERCSQLLGRVRITQNLDFSEYLSDTWGPYNTKFNILNALKCLKKFDQEWLESYLMLYDSLK